jgi:CRISPR/Cas system-associated exonuclease Cas4 (RecB family)
MSDEVSFGEINDIARKVDTLFTRALLSKWGAYIRHVPIKITPPVRLYPSQLGHCLRQQYYTYLYGDPTEPAPEAALLMLLGRSLHETIEESLPGFSDGDARFLASEQSCEVPVDDLAVLVGRADVLVEVSGRKVVVEMKTVQYIPPFPAFPHVLQVQTYINALNTDLGAVYYFERATGARQVFAVQRDQGIFSYIIERARALAKALIERTPPPPEPGEWCSYCMFRANCPIAGAPVRPSAAPPSAARDKA